MDIERVPAWRALGPAGAGECLATDDGTETIEEGAREARLHRGERDPAAVPAQHAVVVEAGFFVAGAVGGSGGPAAEGLDAGPDVVVGYRHPDPVLQGIVHDGRGHIGRDEEQAGPAERAQPVALTALDRPSHHYDVGVHGCDRRETTFHKCFGEMKPARSCLADRHSPGRGMVKATTR